MLSATTIGTVMYASMLVLLCVGFSFTHMMEKFPNFAHISYANIGTLFTYSLVRLGGWNPYASWPVAALVNGFAAVGIYLLIVRPMQHRGANGIHLTFAMFALTYLLRSLMLVYSFWVLKAYGFSSGWFALRSYDFTFNDLPGIFFVAPVVSIALVVLLHFFLTRAKLGIAFRATAEDEYLASGLGIDTQHVHLLSWFMTGAIAGIAGALLPIWQPMDLSGSDDLMINVVAGSVLGGLDNIYGAIIGGVFLAFTQRVLPVTLIRIFGPWIAGYQSLTPIVIIVITLLIEPKGILEIFYRVSRWYEKKIRTPIRNSDAGSTAKLHSA
jgi:branched-chain amino acid transport system permease protein